MVGESKIQIDGKYAVFQMYFEHLHNWKSIEKCVGSYTWKEKLRPVEGVDQDGHLCLDKWLQMIFKNWHNVLQTLDDSPIDVVRGQLKN